MKFIRYLLIIVAIIIAIIFFTFDKIIKTTIVEYAEDSLKTSVSIATAESSFTDKSLELQLVKVQNPEGFKAPNALKIDNFKVKIGSELSSDLITIETISLSGILATLEQNNSGINIKMLTQNLEENDHNSDDKKEDKEVSDEVISININELTITDSKVVVDTLILKEEIKLPNITLNNIKANSKNISSVVIKVLLKEIQKAVDKKGVNIAKDKLEKALTRKISEKIGLKGDTLDVLKEQAKEKTNAITDKIKGMFNF